MQNVQNERKRAAVDALANANPAKGRGRKKQVFIQLDRAEC